MCSKPRKPHLKPGPSAWLDSLKKKEKKKKKASVSKEEEGEEEVEAKKTCGRPRWSR